MADLMDGQTDIFDFLEAPAKASQPPFKVHHLGWHSKPACGWCGGPGYLGGGACRWPEDDNISIGYNYCQKCVDKYGHPEVRAGGTPLVMMSREEMRIFCPYCSANWGRDLPKATLASHAADHAQAEPGRCKEMVEKGITEPYYTPTETPWLFGTTIQYPRPKGYGGLYQLGKE
ncbi:hypothetical protein PP353_gp60 [Arthrobacter phage Kumotta]|uniref:Uncharacterized protein n=2 Tax=Kumottavirus TaxID=3044749 RepID=A0A4Y6EUH6_9CAUD|nr:hypothetical protein PP353_gp60 [Arthrobacter phage Kumotta]YP_010649538.1 hypothetical protein PP356_gp56 [Arthrobacter phage MargaretKali]AXH44436.1 hypothetical protein SEA_MARGARETKALI_56 [Arthrobacter phage MargaretKali]QDF19569.1 hypothetical protein SEA_KUMOTTA_60 [Arthrobacter phage Kumotta]